MQRIERYGVIALVFLLVTILAVAVWGQRKNQSLLSFLKRDKSAEIAKVDPMTPSTVDPLNPNGTPPLSIPEYAPTPGDSNGTVVNNFELPIPTGPLGKPVDFGALPGGDRTPPPIVNPSDVVTTPPSGDGFLDTPPPTGGGIVEPFTPKSNGARTYTVKNGDTLGGIARRELGSTKRWTEISTLNNVQPERLKVGMVLTMPAAGAVVPTPVDASKVARDDSKKKASAGASSYTVRSGDSLSRIAARSLGDANRYGEILALNPGVRADKLAVGQVLRLPEGARAAPAVSKPRGSDQPALAKASPTSKKARVQ